VKAGAGALEAASIAAPVTAAIAPWERMRSFMGSSCLAKPFINNPLLARSFHERQIGARAALTQLDHKFRPIGLAEPLRVGLRTFFEDLDRKGLAARLLRQV
jgi:hypothetical protein